MADKKLSDELREVGFTKTKLARELDVSPEQVSRWGDNPPRYAKAFIKQLKKNQEIQSKLNAFMEDAGVLDADSSLSIDSTVNKYNHISEITDKSQSAIVVFTRGMFLEIRDNQTGSTGNWVIDPDKEVDKIVIYLRDENTTLPTNDLFIGDYVWAEGPLEDGKRYRIHFKNLEQIGCTDKNWKEFADGGANPVKYINA